MKNKLLRFIFILVLFLSNVSYSQWQTDVRLTNNSALSKYPKIAVSGSIVHVVWVDDRDGNAEIYYKRSTNSGLSWSVDTRLTNDTAYSDAPDIAVIGSIVHLVWMDKRPGRFEIYYKRSTNAGANWTTDIQLVSSRLGSETPKIAVSNTYVFVVWYDSYNREIFYKKSTNAGISWNDDVQLTLYDTYRSSDPSIEISDLVIHLVWCDERDWNTEIYYKRSPDAGVSWGSDTRLTNNSAHSIAPSISVAGSLVHVAWSDRRDGNYEVYYKQSTDYGTVWSSDTRLTNTTPPLWDPIAPQIASSGSIVHIVWQDSFDLNYEIYYKRSTNAGVSWSSITRLTNNIAVSTNPSIAVSDSVVHIVWQESRDGNWEIYYKRNPTGNVITNVETISKNIPEKFKLDQNYPNPFNSTTTISFDLPFKSFISLKVYNVLGQEVATLISEELNPGKYVKQWNAENLTSGIYYYCIQTNSFSETKKSLLIK